MVESWENCQNACRQNIPSSQKRCFYKTIDENVSEEFKEKVEEIEKNNPFLQKQLKKEKKKSPNQKGNGKKGKRKGKGDNA